MTTYRVETTISKDKTITVTDLPFSVGDKVEVVVRSHAANQNRQNRYPLRGQPVRYKKPFDGVAESEWDSIQ